MKYKKLIASCFAHRSHTTAYVAVAVVAGLAAGAVISLLFAPEKGADTRGMIADKARGVGGQLKDTYATLKNKIAGETEAEPVEEEQTETKRVGKKPKSDVKELIKEAHQSDHTEQAIS